MRLRVFHQTTFAYASAVAESHNEVRLKPANRDTQQLLSWKLTTQPVAKVFELNDFYLNQIHAFDIHPPHTELVVVAESTVATTPDSRGQPSGAFPIAEIKPQAFAENLYDFLQDSRYVSLAPEVWKIALDALDGQPAQDAWQATLALGRYVYQNFQYKPASTEVGTPMIEALHQRSGVCQDFAHILCGLCRTMKIPTRYVSGYFYDAANTAATQATHAWVEVFLPGYGWASWDPTHDCPADERYIKIGHGRDYHDVRPASGTYRGNPRHCMDVAVKVSACASGSG